MDPHVRIKRGELNEALPAGFAFVIPLLCVNPLVSLEIPLVLERLSTDVAVVIPLSGVHNNMAS